MKFFVLASTAFYAVIAAAQQDTGKFGLVVIRSGSPVQNSPIRISGNDLVAGGSGTDFEGFLSLGALWNSAAESNGKSVIRDITTSKLVLDPNPEPHFAVDGGYLSYNGTQAFTVLPIGEGQGYQVYTGSLTQEGAIPVALKVIESAANSTTTTTAAAGSNATVPVATSSAAAGGVAPPQQSTAVQPINPPAATEPAPGQVNAATGRSVSGAALVAAVAGVAALL